MSLSRLYQRRRWSAAFALAAMAFYAVLLPWHTTSQTYAQIAQAELMPASGHHCHKVAVSDPAPGTKPSKRSHCPICSGFAALQLAVAGTVAIIPAGPEATLPTAILAEHDLADVPLSAPHNRGPPLLRA